MVALEVVPNAEGADPVADPAGALHRCGRIVGGDEHAASAAVPIIGEVVLAYGQPPGRVRGHGRQHVGGPQLVRVVPRWSLPQIHEPRWRRAVDVAGDDRNAHGTEATTG